MAMAYLRRRRRPTMTRFSISMLLLSCLCPSAATSASSSLGDVYAVVRGASMDESASADGHVRRDVYVTNNSGDSVPPNRVLVDAFELVLAPTSSEMSEEEEYQMHDLVQEVVNQAVAGQVLPDGTSFEYVLLAEVQGKFHSGRLLQQGQTTLLFNGGVASFTGTDLPSSSEIAGWVQTSLEQTLTEQLPSTFSSITSVTYLSLSSTPTAAPELTVAGVTENPNISDDSNPPILAIGVIGGILVVGLVSVFFVVRSRMQSRADVYPQEPKNQNSDLASISGGDDYNASREPGDLSLDGSEFTLATMTDDGARSLASRKFLPANSVPRTESFEHERQVSLRKDMLHTTPAWNSSSPIFTLPRSHGDTVLQPSHFIASDHPDEFNPDDIWNPDDNDVSIPPPNESPFRFEANDGEGEEIYIMAPSQTRQARAVSCDVK